MRVLFRLLVVLVVLSALGYYPLVVHSPTPDGPPFVLDIEKIRQLSRSLPGPVPYQIRVEQVADWVFAEAMVMSGEPWRRSVMTGYAYQLVRPGNAIIVDTAMANMEGLPEPIAGGFDEAAYQRVSEAMDKAGLIVITHEHFDHIAGLLEHPNLSQLLPAVKLTKEQLSNPDAMKPAELPAEVFDDYQPLVYDQLFALAPGVVLIKSPGHSLGSQMVYVRLYDGREVLLLGDVAWKNMNIEAVRERPLFMTALIKENRQQVINQFQALHDLAKQAPEVKQIPGHDADVVNGLIEAGFLTPGFK